MQYRYFHEGQLKIDPSTGTRCRTGQLNHQFIEQKFVGGVWVGIGDADGVRYGDVAAAGCRFREGIRDGDYVVDVETKVAGFLLAEGDGWTNCGSVEGYWTPLKALKTGVSSANLIAAYDAVNAKTLVNSYINIANPGTYDITAGTAPDWNKTDGWKFATNKYLKTGFKPVSQDRTYIVVHTGWEYTQWGEFLGCQSTVPTKTVTIMNNDTLAHGRAINNGAGVSVTTPFNKSGISILTGSSFYTDGCLLKDSIGLGNGIPDLEIYIGTNNVNGNSDKFITANIQLVAIYDIVLTEAQIGIIVRGLKRALSVKESYFTLSTEELIISKDVAWETSSPHTMSVVECNLGGYKYWGYYGLQASINNSVGLARSNDLSTWTKYATNPLPTITGRWPSVVLRGGVFYMAMTHFTNNTIELLSSVDGITFTTIKTIVAVEAGFVNDNPNLYFNTNDNKWYLYWVNIRNADSYEIIKGKCSANIEDLDAAVPANILESASVLAAPNIMYYGGKYYLLAEVIVNATWCTSAFISDDPLSGFVELKNSPVLVTGIACAQQYIFNGELHIYCAKNIAEVWSFDHVKGWFN